MEAKRTTVLVCGGGGCVSSGCKAVKDSLVSELQKKFLDDQVEITVTGCMGPCDLGPMIIVNPDGVMYRNVNVEDVVDIVDEHIQNGQIVRRLLYQDPITHEKIETVNEFPFYSKQQKIVLRNCGAIDPLSIDDYIAHDGYKALKKVLLEMTPQEVVAQIKDSGLRGRGGAGFPTGTKWEMAAKSVSDVKYVVANGDEGDPGAFMDRSILEGDPHGIIEAMTIAGYAIGSSKGCVYVRAEYPQAISTLKYAIEQALKAGYLGDKIFGTDFSFTLEIRVGAGAFVCGEETALLRSIESKRGEPRPRPPFPAVAGLWDKPTLINNIETYANITAIILNGPEWFSSIGTSGSKGTKVFALAGKVNNTGLVEVPMGTSLREIVFDIGGGVPDGKTFKAAQTGGPSGGCIPSQHLDTSIDYESLKAIGTMVGSGGLIVMDEDTCMVDLAKFFLTFIQDESCGKCAPCRIGTKRMLEALERITLGNGTKDDIESLKELAEVIKDTSLCGLGQTAPNPVLSTMTYFMDEYEQHVSEKKCTAKVCQNMLNYHITEACIGCTRCVRSCPSECITGALKTRHVIDTEKCIKCGACQSICPVKAVVRE